MKAIIYARQSSGNDDISESVEAQIQNCCQLAQKEKLEIVGVFKDLNTSGETYPEGAENIAAIDSAYKEWSESQSCKKNYRSGLGDLLKNLSGINVILVNELTRLYRPINGSFLEGHINHILKKHNIQVMQVQGGSIDLTKFDQQLITSIKNQILYDDLQKKRQNSINAFRIKRDSGKCCCGTKVFGLRYMGNDVIEVKEECIEIIRYIYDSICEYKSYSSIVRECNERFKKHRFFYGSSIYNIAKQPLYAGLQYNTSGELIKNVQLQGKEIIHPAQWHIVQDIVNTKRRSYHNKSKKHWLPLSGRLICGYCGKHLVCSIDKGRIYYICNRCNLDRESNTCRNSRIRFETGAWNQPALYDTIYPLLVIALVERQKRATDKNAGLLQLNRYVNELKKLKAAERRLYDLYFEGLVSEEQLVDMLFLHRTKKEALSGNISRLQIIGAGPNPYQPSNHILPELFRKFRNGKLQNHIYQSLLIEADIRITVFREYISVSTIYGILEIPRLWSNRRCIMPEWKLAFYDKNNDDTTEQFSHISKIIITFKTGCKKTLAVFDRIIIKSV